MTIYDAAMRYAAEGTPLVVLAGKEYGSGSSRDWAAKGARCSGVRAVLAESFERIHRSNLVGMGVLPLQFLPGESASSLGLGGEEVFDITGLEGAAEGGCQTGSSVHATGATAMKTFEVSAPHRHASRGASTTVTAGSSPTCSASCCSRADPGRVAAGDRDHRQVRARHPAPLLAVPGVTASLWASSRMHHRRSALRK